jgi:hypothetical protein
MLRSIPQPRGMPMRNFIRHPADIPIEVAKTGGLWASGDAVDFGHGGLSLVASGPHAVGELLHLRIPFVKPPFDARGRVAWCRRRRGRYQLGVAFLDSEDAFQARMVEQVCHIEHYRRQQLERDGRTLTRREAALEWIARYAANFPAADSESRH